MCFPMLFQNVKFSLLYTKGLFEISQYDPTDVIVSEFKNEIVSMDFICWMSISLQAPSYPAAKRRGCEWACRRIAGPNTDLSPSAR